MHFWCFLFDEVSWSIRLCIHFIDCNVGNYLSKLSKGVFPHQFLCNSHWFDSSEDKCEGPLGYWFSTVSCYIRQMLQISHNKLLLLIMNNLLVIFSRNVLCRQHKRESQRQRLFCLLVYILQTLQTQQHSRPTIHPPTSAQISVAGTSLAVIRNLIAFGFSVQ